jgi:calcium-dependent protein kinase
MGCCLSKKKVVPKSLQAVLVHKTEESSSIYLSIRPEAFISLKQGDIHTQFQFTKLLGVGAYGRVHRVVHRTTGLVRAVKTVRKERAAKDLIEGPVYSNEIDILRVMNHPNVLKMHEFYEDSRSYHMVTELVTGGELFEVIVSSSQLSEQIAAHFFRQILSAVCYLHASGVVHRDLKPENLLLDAPSASATLKVIDFGSAAFYTPGQRFTKRHGTANYVAPEVLARNYDEMCDMWSCGVILYILLSGKPPFTGNNDTEILEVVKKAQYSFESALWRDVSNSAKHLISMLLQYNPRDRVTARQALDHEWLQVSLKETVSSRSLLLPGVLSSLRQFRVAQKLQHAVMTFIVTQTAVDKDSRELALTFQRLDCNGDGRISTEELLAEYQKLMGPVEAQEEVAWIMQQVDIDHSGYIDYSEFIMATSKRDALVNRSNLEQCFKCFDSDGNGMISSGELKAILGNPQSDHDIWAMLIAEVDANGDGMIDFAEFKDMMMRIH